MNNFRTIAFATVLLMVAGSGCVKSIDSHSATTVSPGTTAASSSVVYTPFGPRRASDVIHLEAGYHLRWDGDHLLKVDRSGNAVLDLGRQEPLSYLRKTERGVRMIDEDKEGAPPVPTLGSGWITDGSLPQQSPVTYFATTWIVPTTPPANDGQTLYLFNGLEDGLASTNHIFQPVLQFGPGPDIRNTGNNWYVDNWYASCSTCPAIVGTPVQVTSTTSLTGVIQQTGQSGGSYSYSASFTGAAYDDATLAVDNVSPLTYPFETMEAYNMQDANDYPADDYVRMSNINIQTGTGVYPATYWSANDIVTDIGQQTIIVSDKDPGGDVDLYFHSMPAITGGGTFTYTTGSPSGGGTVTGSAGRYVSVGMWASGKPGQTYSLRVSLTGSYFVSNNTGFQAVTDGSLSDGFYLPASGTVTWQANYSASMSGFTGRLTLQ